MPQKVVRCIERTVFLVFVVTQLIRLGFLFRLTSSPPSLVFVSIAL